MIEAQIDAVADQIKEEISCGQLQNSETAIKRLNELFKGIECSGLEDLRQKETARIGAKLGLALGYLAAIKPPLGEE